MLKSAILKILGTKIREERIKKGWTIEQLAESINLSANFLGLVEHSKKSISIENLCKISELLEVTTDSLLKEYVQTTEDKANILKMLADDLSEEEFSFIVDTIKSVKSHFRKNTQEK